MNFTQRCFFVAFVSIYISFIYKIYNDVFRPLPRPKINLNEYWGPGLDTNYKEDTNIITFNISYSNKIIKELQHNLKQKLNFPEPLENINFEYGFNTNSLKKIIDYWRDDYLTRWSERQNYLNKYQHFKTQIQGLQIHFIHQKANDAVKRTKVVYPVLLLHGWPGSVREFYDIIMKLTTANKKNEYVFEVVAPSLPGYGWSQASSKTGFGQLQMSVVLRNLMLRLGYKKFFVQGGDWGAAIGRDIATMFPENVIGFHTNSCIHSSPLSIAKMFLASLFPTLFFPQNEIGFYFPLKEKFTFLIQESGYFYIQATKPDTIGTTLQGNPIGLAAYMLEKFSTWTNRKNLKLLDGGLGKDIKMDNILDNIMIYYLTNSITTSQRLYAEAWSNEELTTRVPVLPPTGCARFKNDLLHSFDWQLQEKYKNLIHSKHYQNGGHFAAMQVPDILYNDFIIFAGKVLGNNSKI